MILPSTALIALAAGAFGLVAGYVLRQIIAQQRRNSIELKIKQILLDAKSEAQKTLDEAKLKADSVLESVKREEKERETALRRLEERIGQKEESVEKRRADIERETKDVVKQKEDLKRRYESLESVETERRKELEKLSGLSEEEAKSALMTSVEKKYESDILTRMQKLENFGQEKLEQRARETIASVIQRLASSTASEITTTSVAIPSDDIKGKIIGKEGRNIRALEKAAGVEVIVDDTPGSIIISSFDPVRRHVAKVALENLILDGRIQPTRIEEMVEKARAEVEKIMKEAGEAAIYEVGVFDIDARLVNLLGRLRFRTSFGQNVLQHSIEMTHLAGMLASELGADVQISKKGALFHDIGKAMDHEIQGTHVEIGRRILQKFNVDEKIIKAMQSHHDEYPHESLEAIIVQIADNISGARPGARRDTVENYLKRLEELEKIANSFSGVEKSYAIQAGREIRIFVSPEKISDLEMKKMARDIADKVEQDLKYPGEIKVHVIRENRVVEYAR
ncbi:MAG: ribonuclease Y [Candidatus Niyogibacteria bacterium]|nr:MAG: ribonuclease Y [Candidatus Niyogibacteria bacterium]